MHLVPLRSLTSYKTNIAAIISMEAAQQELVMMMLPVTILIGMCRTEVLVLVEVFGFIILALSACYTYCVWRRIPFAAAANLNTGMTAVKANGRIFIMAYVSVALLWGEYLRISRNGWKL